MSEPPLVGRDREIAELGSVLADPESRGALLSGAPGTGRSRLLRETARIGRRQGMRTVRAAGSAATEEVPLGAFAHALPPAPDGADRLALLQHALTALRGDGDRPLLAVDDAHRLDGLSVAVLEQLLLGGDAVVVLTEPTGVAGAPEHDRLGTVRDEVRVVQLTPLPDHAAEDLLAAMLDGDVESRTAYRLTTLAAGVPGVLRGLLRAGVDGGRLVVESGLWRWDGEMERPQRTGGPATGTDGTAAPPDTGPADLAAAAGANHALDHGRAERIARPLTDDDPDGSAHLELIEAVRWQDRGPELPELLAAADDRVGTADDRARLALTRVLLAHRQGGTALPPGGGPDLHPAVREVAALLDGRGSTVAVDAAELPDHAPWDALARAARAGRLACAGQTARALDTVDRTRALLEGTDRAETALARLLLIDAELVALRVAGRGGAAERVAAAAHRRNVTVVHWAGDAWIAYCRGRAALLRGDLAEAVRRLTEARSAAARGDPLGLAAECAGTLTLAHAVSGDLSTAREVLAGAPADPPVGGRTALARARVWLDAFGRPGAAVVRPLLDLARAAAERGDRVTEVGLLHDVARLGRADLVVAPLSDVSRCTGAPLAALYAAHAVAVANDAGSRLDRVAADLEAAGARPAAADASASAAAAHDRAGDRRRCAMSSARAVRLGGECGGLRTPQLDRVVRPHLTTREREVAELVAAGTSNAQVARRLVLSVRTVESHLAHTYAKLGIEGRAELAAALPQAGPGR